MLELQAHPSTPYPRSKAEVSFNLNGKYLNVEFDIQTHQLHTNDSFQLDTWDNWGLWESDVVEVFVKRDGSDYLELQVSPLNQKFALLVKKPRLDFAKVSPQNTEVFAMRTDKGFRAQFKIDANDIPGHGDQIYGNFHACLGISDNREYYSYRLNPEPKADFHKPNLFELIGKL